MKKLEDMTHLELLGEFNNRVCVYDGRRDDELRFLEDHPNRDLWDDEQEMEYGEMLEDILHLHSKVRECSDFINGIVHGESEK